MNYNDDVNRAEPEYTAVRSDDYIVKTVDKPVAVHVFNHCVVIVGNDGSVIQLMRR